MMRKNLIYGALILCMGLLLSSCGKDDDPKTNGLAGTWKLKEKGHTEVVWEAPSDAVLEVMGQKFTANMLSPYLTSTLGNLVKAAVKDVTLTSDGKVQGTFFKSETKTWATSDGFATYKDEGNGRMRLFIDTDKAFAGSTLDAQTLTQIKAALKNGIPVCYTISGNNARFYLDTETIKSMGSYLPVIFSMAGKMPSGVMEGLKAGLASMVEKSTKIEFALNMER